MNADAVRVAGRCAKMAKELSGEAQAKRLRAAGAKAAKEVTQAVRSTPVKSGSLADLKLSAHGRPSTKSGWHKVSLEAKAYVVGTSFVVKPISQAYGPLRVLESGRKARRAGQLRARGQRTSKKTGATSTRLARVSRSSGATQAKGTWSKARQSMAKVAGPYYAAEVAKSFKSTFGG